MTRRESDWPIAEPPADFASRTVTAVLRDRQRRRRVATRRWAAVMAAATLLFAGVAWGFTAWTKRAEPVAPAPPAASAAPPPPAPVHASPPPTPEPEPTVEPPAPPAPARPHHRPPPAAAVVDAGYRPIVPRCDCVPDQTLCTCF